MAKRTGTVAATEHKIEEFAEDLGRMLGHARSKAEGWLGQRETIVKNLTQLRDEATKLLSQLGHEAETMVRRGRRPLARGVRKLRGRPAVGLVVNKIRGAAPAARKGANKIIFVGGKTRRTMSAKARKAISQAQKLRWAKLKAAAKK